MFYHSNKKITGSKILDQSGIHARTASWWTGEWQMGLGTGEFRWGERREKHWEKQLEGEHFRR